MSSDFDAGYAAGWAAAWNNENETEAEFSRKEIASLRAELAKSEDWIRILEKTHETNNRLSDERHYAAARKDAETIEHLRTELVAYCNQRETDAARIMALQIQMDEAACKDAAATSSLRAEITEWKQAASVEAGLRREFAETIEHLRAELTNTEKARDEYLRMARLHEDGLVAAKVEIERYKADRDDLLNNAG